MNGLNPLAYVGVEPSTPPELVREKRRPTQNDYQNYTVGTIWLVKDTEEIWMLVDKKNNIANWTLTTSGDLTFLTDDGNNAHPHLGIVTIIGGPNIDTSAVPPGGSHLIIGLQDDVNIHGNLNVGTLIPGGALLADGAGLVSAANGADGQLLIGGAAAPTWGSIASADGSVIITEGPNTLNLSVIGGAGAFGGLIDELGNVAAPDGLSRVTVDAGSMIATDATIAPNVLRVSVIDAPVAANPQFVYCDAGGGVPRWGTVAAGTGVAVTELADVVTISAGGGNDGQILISDTATHTPAWANITSAVPTIAITSGANTIALDVHGGNDGQFLISRTDTHVPAWATITGGTLITSTPGANTVTIAATAAGVAATPQLIYAPAAGGAGAWGRFAAAGGATIGEAGGVITITAGAGGAGGAVILHTNGADAAIDIVDSSFDILGGNVVVTSSTIANTVTVALTQGADGHVVIGATGAAPIWAALTAGAGITVTPGVNSITIANSAMGGFAGLVADDATVAAPDGLTHINVLGDNLIETSGDGVSTLYVGLTQTGTNGQIPISTTGAFDPVWANITPLNLIGVTDAAGSISIGLTQTGTDGQIPISATGALDPAWAEITGGTLITSTPGPNTITIGIADAGAVANPQFVYAPAAGGAAAWATLTSIGGTVTITPGVATINLESAGFGGLKDDADAIAAPDGVHTVKIAGGTLMDTLTGLNMVTVGLEYVNGLDLDPDGSYRYDGRLIISAHAGPPIWAKLTAGPGISITPNVNQITIANTGGGGAGGGVNLFDCISGTAYPKTTVDPTLIFIEGDLDPAAGGYDNITTTARLQPPVPGELHDVWDTVEIVLKPRINLPSTTSWNAGIIYLGANAAAGGVGRFIHNYSAGGAAGLNAFFGNNAGNLTMHANVKYNIGIGRNSLGSLSNVAGAGEGCKNVAVGYDSLAGLTTGKWNTALGCTAMILCTTGSYNTATGSDALDNLTTGSHNTCIGNGAGTSLVNHSWNTAVGSLALEDATSSYNTAVGYGSSSNITTGVNNVTMGYQSLFTATTSNYTTAIGDSALRSTTTKDGNTAVGYCAGRNIVTGRENTIMGYNAMSATTTAHDNVVIGSRAALGSFGGGKNVLIGPGAGTAATGGGSNVGIGAPLNINPPWTNSVLHSLTSGSFNVAIGTASLAGVTTGTYNVGIGYSAGGTITTTSQNIFISNTGVVGDVNTTRIGTQDVFQTPHIEKCYIAGIRGVGIGNASHPVYVDADGKLGKTGVGFAARPSVNINNVTGDTTRYYLGTGSAPMILFYNYGGGTFYAGAAGTAAHWAAPISGVYLVTFMLRFNGIIPPTDPPAPPPPPPPSYNIDPIVIETSQHGWYSFQPTLISNHYDDNDSYSFTCTSVLAQGETLRWYVEIDYRPGILRDYSAATGRRKCLGIDASSAVSPNDYKFTQVSATLLMGV